VFTHFAEAAMDRMWIVLADEGRARLIERAPPGGAMQEVAQIEDELGRARGAELRRDAKGRLYGKGERVMGHTTEPRTDARRKEAQRFARRVAEYLEQAQREQRFDRLVIVAAPAFLGMLREVLPPAVRKQVVGELDQDLVNLDFPTLAQRLAALPTPA
jgi:protein required for attachment to host cells